MVHDFRNGTTQVDGTHIDDFTFGVDWSLFSPATPLERVQQEREELAASYRERITQGLEINIHFHTFEPDSMVALIDAANLALGSTDRIEVVAVHERFPANNPIGFLVVARVNKPRPPWKKAHRPGASPLRPDAQRL